MTCTRPIYTRFLAGVDKRPIFNPGHQDMQKPIVPLPCGQCLHCRQAKARDWALRCAHEAKMHEHNSFLTLTYENAPPSISKRELQLFMKKLRKKYNGKTIRFFACGEYGDQTDRAHYHALIFGHDFEDKKFYTKGKNGDRIYTSDQLDTVWGLGHGFIGDVSDKSAAYVARYSLKKITGLGSRAAYGSNEPPFLLMSRMPGIGKTWFEKHHKDVFPQDFIIHNGTKRQVPAYYDKLYAAMDPEHMAEIKQQRQENAPELTDTQLHAKEVIATQKQSFIRREI